VRPIEHPAEMGRLVAAAAVEAERDFAQSLEVQRSAPTRRVRSLHERSGGLRALVAILAMLDAGLRIGEVAGLTCGQVRWGESEDDPARALVIDRARSLAGIEEKPKSGRTRVVALSRRLRNVQLELYRLQLEPGPSARAFPGFDPQNFRHRVWRRIRSRARIGDRAPKDLRDTFASQLLSAGPLSLRVAPARTRGHCDHFGKYASLLRGGRQPYVGRPKKST
jgi:integrase